MDKINPNHYRDINGKQCIDHMISIFGVKKVLAFCELNAYKYKFRAGKKEGEKYKEDLEKAKWYENKIYELEHKMNL